MDITSRATAKPTLLGLLLELRENVYRHIRCRKDSKKNHLRRIGESTLLFVDCRNIWMRDPDPLDFSAIAALTQSCRQIHNELANRHYQDWLFWITISNNLEAGELDDISTVMDPSTIPSCADFSFLAKMEYCKTDVALDTKRSFATEVELLGGTLTELRASVTLHELAFNVTRLSVPGVYGLLKSIEMLVSIEDLGVEVWKEFAMQSKTSKAMYLEIGARAVEILKRGSKKDLAVIGEDDES